MLLSALLTGAAAAQSPEPEVVIVGATPAGVAAAVAAARSGASVVLVEESSHVGGIVAGGLTNTDIRKHAAVGGLYNEFKRRIREHYAKTYGDDSLEVRLCKDGNRFEPKVAEQIFREMLAGEKNIRLLTGERVTAAQAMGTDKIERPATAGRRIDGAAPDDFGPASKLIGLAVQNLAAGDKPMELRAAVFIDATYEGDLAALAGAAYRVGRESRQNVRRAARRQNLLALWRSQSAARLDAARPTTASRPFAFASI